MKYGIILTLIAIIYAGTACQKESLPASEPTPDSLLSLNNIVDSLQGIHTGLYYNTNSAF